MATNFVGKIDLVVHMTFARAAPPARQEGQLLRRAQANELPDSMDAGEPIT